MTLATILITHYEPQIRRLVGWLCQAPGRIPDVADIFARMRGTSLFLTSKGLVKTAALRNSYL